ncbi:hypothetical protein B0T26DRAFT_836193 [Lasiosphaeria miniovina]|uniref:Uncharacterized protein n=1 Tax=Lasiosphaeria miniovina TaxID=1954250 RepID=A0AA40DQS1_9PEZI|nr:uncharacterized protein B0T26DRAFT_836193 [Lasiosphaeria miniovina]KAK0710031.1 hypothetical protein B0T26DRAFT_836193 [Lasiosphaeria miniovina]
MSHLAGSHLIGAHTKALHETGKQEVVSIQNHTKQPTNYRQQGTVWRPARDMQEEPVIPAPGLFATLVLPRDTDHAGADADADALPTVGECATHLQLLHVFYALRVRIIESAELDKTFGVEQNRTTVWRTRYSGRYGRSEKYQHPLGDATWKARRKEKFRYYLIVAAARFQEWVKKADAVLAETKQGTGSLCLAFLPPLDVLMVWHAFLLNPRDFEDYCRKHRLERIRKVPFPWAQIHSAIDSRTDTFMLPKDAAASADSTGLAPDLFAFLADVSKAPSSVAPTLARKAATTSAESNFLLVLFTHGGTPATPNTTTATATATANSNTALIANVQRQAVFADKMHAQLWLRSPAVLRTLSRAISRYAQFLALFRAHPGQTLVPALDVDLAWHTHQLSASAYGAGVRARAGRFIDHDDKLGVGVLKGALERTAEWYFVAFGGLYAPCLCWDCEAVAEVLEREANGDMDEDGDGDGDLDGEEEEDRMGRLVDAVQDELHYYRSVEAARRARKQLPVREKVPA